MGDYSDHPVCVSAILFSFNFFWGLLFFVLGLLFICLFCFFFSFETDGQSAI